MAASTALQAARSSVPSSRRAIALARSGNGETRGSFSKTGTQKLR
ncbi:hypothetical protein [Oxynema sp. CENA135]|nr:hypothetical protein [Oxynema sp. CENA135]